MDNLNNTIYFQRLKEWLLHAKEVLLEVFWNPDQVHAQEKTTV